MTKTATTHYYPRVRVKKAIDHFGGRKELAEYFGISPEAVMNWQRTRLHLPEGRAWHVAAELPQLVDGRKKAA